MHLTLKKEATRPASRNFLQQQARFDQFIQCFNFERPHQALNMKYPAELYSPSPRPYQGLGELEYPFHDRTLMVTSCGRICIGRRKINLSQVFAGQKVGIKEVSEKIWLVTFMHYDLGFFDEECGRVECAENPFGAKLMEWSPPSLEGIDMPKWAHHRSAPATVRSDQHEHHDCRSRSREECNSDPRRGRTGSRRFEEEAETHAGIGVLRQLAALPGWHGSMRRCALLGAQVAGA